jgi:hypothetical protein
MALVLPARGKFAPDAKNLIQFLVTKFDNLQSRRGARVVKWAGLENRSIRTKGTASSNLALSANSS